MSRIKDLTLKDLKSIFLLIISILLLPFFRGKYKEIWLISEDEFEARDNGFVFFKYLNKEVPNQKVIYAINKKSVDYEKIKKIGEIVEYGTIRHWLYYLCCENNITTQKAGKPNAAIGYILEVFGIIKNKTIFLQHGVIINDCKWLYYPVTKFKLFFCGGFLEYEYVKKKFKYPLEKVSYTGLCRYDELHEECTKKNRIVIMPTWRNWLVMNSKKNQELQNSEYFDKWNEFINSENLLKFAKDKNLEIIFYPHRNMQDQIKKFSKNKVVKILRAEDIDIQDLIKTSNLLITDYSSVFTDFIYMKKPIIFYQFDREKFIENQYQEGYFDYLNNYFGKTYKNVELIINELKRIVDNEFKVDELYLEGHKSFFMKYDKKNCERTYNEIKKVSRK
ncbi:MAG: CDP-glycerol glycerophosphotransferase family protein [Clostridium sp.]|uniref:CDP-glycerol glycerophosphotransferase family protein n=1 Tax=Clostridium sp. TaxID=1506 RepID=UPI003EE50313